MIGDVEKLGVAERYAAATRAGDADALAAVCEPDAVVWHNFDNASVSADRAARTLRWLHGAAPDVAWTDVAVLVTTNGFVWQALLTGTGPGGPFAASTCMVVTLSDRGLVAKTEEYIDPAALAVLQT
ncbi:MAG TPA: nuclear transport factor 2 family protein [Ilumatobacter sp.]|nr:nuclear transport factor 2 family protein [Ilumatobacter sp.]